MTRKDYTAIAAALNAAMNHQAYHGNAAFTRGVRECALQIAAALARDNSRFDLSRFLTAAGVAR